MKNYDPNMLSFVIVEGWNKLYVVVSYVPLNDQPMLHWVEQALAYCLERTEMLLV